MRRTLWSYLAALAIACLLQVSVVTAQEVATQEVETQEFQSEPAQLPEGVLQTGLFAAAVAGPTGDCSGGDCSTACDTGCAPRRCRTITGTAELPLLTPYIGSLFIGAPGVGQITPDFDTQISSRFSLGVENQEGLGGRIRYWLFDHDTGTLAPAGGIFAISQGLKAQTLDLEVTQATEFRDWQLGWFGGMRYANQRYSLGLGAGGIFGGSLDTKFEGVGPTIGLSALRPIRSGRVSLYGGLRGSLIFGDTRLGGTGDLAAALNAVDVRVNEHSLQIWELNMGVQYGHGPLFVRAGYEAQVWESGLPLINFDVGYAGPTIALGFIR